MTNAELLAKIKAEIDKRYAEYRAKMKTDDFTYYEGMADALDLFEQFIDTLESEKPIPADLEEAAEISFDEAKSLTEEHIDFIKNGLIENKSRPIGPHWFCEYAKNRFIAGAKWMAEQLKK